MKLELKVGRNYKLRQKVAAYRPMLCEWGKSERPMMGKKVKAVIHDVIQKCWYRSFTL